MLSASQNYSLCKGCTPPAISRLGTPGVVTADKRSRLIWISSSVFSQTGWCVLGDRGDSSSAGGVKGRTPEVYSPTNSAWVPDQIPVLTDSSRSKNQTCSEKLTLALVRSLNYTSVLRQAGRNPVPLIKLTNNSFHLVTTKMKLIFQRLCFHCRPDNFQSNMLLVSEQGNKLLIDCGSDIRFSLHAVGFSILISRIFTLVTYMQTM